MGSLSVRECGDSSKSSYRFNSLMNMTMVNVDINRIKEWEFARTRVNNLQYNPVLIALIGSLQRCISSLVIGVDKLFQQKILCSCPLQRPGTLCLASRQIHQLCFQYKTLY